MQKGGKYIMTKRKKSECSFSEYEKTTIIKYLISFKSFVTEKHPEAVVALARISKLIDIYEKSGDIVRVSQKMFYDTVKSSAINNKEYDEPKSGNPSNAVTRGFAIISSYIDEFNKFYEASNEYQIVLDGLIVSIKPNRKSISSLNTSSQKELGCESFLNKRDVNNFINNFLLALKYVVINPSKLHKLHVSNKQWHANLILLFLVLSSIFIVSLITNFAHLFMASEQEIITMILSSGFALYIHMLARYLFLMVLLCIPFKYFFKSKFNLGMLGFANVLSAFFVSMVLMQFYTRGLGTLSGRLNVYDYLAFFFVMICLAHHYVTLKSVFRLNNFKFSVAYSISTICLILTV
jgi:hypothetical protein